MKIKKLLKFETKWYLTVFLSTLYSYYHNYTDILLLLKFKNSHFAIFFWFCKVNTIWKGAICQKTEICVVISVWRCADPFDCCSLNPVVQDLLVLSTHPFYPHFSNSREIHSCSVCHSLLLHSLSHGASCWPLVWLHFLSYMHTYYFDLPDVMFLIKS